MKKKFVLKVFCVSVILVVNALVINAAFAGDANIDVVPTTPCYQTMGYCNNVLTYRCDENKTSEKCRISVCKYCVRPQE